MQRATKGTAVSRPPARHQKPPESSVVRLDPYDYSPYDEAPDRYAPFNEAPHRYAPFNEAPHRYAPFNEAPHRYARYNDAPHGYTRYNDAPYDFAPYDETSYQDARFDQASYDHARFDQASYDHARFDEDVYRDVPYGDASYDEDLHHDGSYDEDLHQDASYEDPHHDAPSDDAPYDDAPYDRGAHGHDVPGPRRPPVRPGAHARHKKPSRMRRKPVKIAAALAGSTLLVSAAVPVAAHWWHRSAGHPTLDQETPTTTGGAALGAGPLVPNQPAAPQNALDQWAQIPIGKHAAAEVRAAKRAARHAAAQRSAAPQPQATSSSAYQNPLRAVSDLVLERVDMGVDFGGAGPVYALGDGVITNATADSTGWPGGGWITYQLTDGPDAGLVVYVAEDVTPTVQVGQKVTSSTVIANMFNGGDGIETGWATSDGSTAESQMTAAGGIGGNGPFPTMVGLSFDAVLESVGVPAAPNASEPGNGLLPAGYPPVA